MSRPKAEYTAPEAVVMRLIREGKITIKDAAELLGCSERTVNSLQAQYGVDTVFIGVRASRKEASEANKARNELLETLAKRIKYEGADIQELSKEHNIPSRTLYRWVHRVS